VGELSVRPAPSRELGFTLLEVMVALAVLGVALLLGLGLLAQQRRVLTRLTAEEQANRAVARVLEELRSGSMSLDEGLSVVPESLALPPATGGIGSGKPAAAGAEDLRLVVRVQRVEPPANLFEATVEAHYRVLGRDRLRRVETLFWKPGKPRPAS